MPGGGPAADALRMLDRVHVLGEEAAHWLALRALSVNAHFLACLLPGAPVVPRPPTPTDAGDAFILDPTAFFQEDDHRPGALPHTWHVTSDSLAVRVAVYAGARELVLLKSVARARGTAGMGSSMRSSPRRCGKRRTCACGSSTCAASIDLRLDRCSGIRQNSV